MFLKDHPNQLSEPSVISGDVANFPRGKRIQISGFRNVDYARFWSVQFWWNYANWDTEWSMWSGENKESFVDKSNSTKSAGVYFTKEISINMKEESSETKETLFGRSDNLIDQDRHSLQKKFAEAQKI